MSLTLIKNISDTCTLALWKIEESVEILVQQSCLDNISLKILEDFHIDKRKKEWLSVRILIKEIFGKNITIEYKENGKPYISEEPYSISISHSKDYVGVIVSRAGEVGLDIENISPRIEKIKHKFLSKNELHDIPAEGSCHKQMLLYWCAKETLMKICGKKEIDFKKQLKIYPFVFATNGSFIGEIIDNQTFLKIELNYFEFDNNIIVWGNI